MRKPPITRVPAILNGLTSRPSGKTDSIYAEIVKWRSTRPWTTSIQVNSNEENGRSSQFLLVSECVSVFRVIRCLKVGTYLSNKGITYLLTEVFQINCLTYLPILCSRGITKLRKWIRSSCRQKFPQSGNSVQWWIRARVILGTNDLQPHFIALYYLLIVSRLQGQMITK